MKEPIYRLVRHVEGHGLMAVDLDPAKGVDVIAALDVSGYKFEGIKEDNRGPIKLRPELVGQPTFDGLAGPMWGGLVDENGNNLFDANALEVGRPVIRYESWEAYERLSA